MNKRDIYYIEVVGKALDVLEVFAHVEKSRLTLREISSEVGLNKNAVFRLLYTLVEHGYIIKDGQTFELGSKLLDLTYAKLRHADLLAVAAPQLEMLHERFKETVNLGVLDEGQIRYVDVRESPERLRLAERVGGRDFLHCTALGKAHLAYLPFEEVRQLMRRHGMPRQTEHTITSLSALKADLDATRSRGYAVDIEESVLGARCVGAPILDERGRPVGAISVSAPLARLADSRVKEVGEALVASTRDIGSKLGFSSSPSAVPAKPSKSGRSGA